MIVITFPFSVFLLFHFYSQIWVVCIVSVWFGWNFRITFPVGSSFDLLKQEFLWELEGQCEAADFAVWRLPCLDVVTGCRGQWVPSCTCSLLQLLLLTVDRVAKLQPQALHQTRGSRPTEMETAQREVDHRTLQEPSICSPIGQPSLVAFSSWVLGDFSHLLDPNFPSSSHNCVRFHIYNKSLTYNKSLIPSVLVAPLPWLNPAWL